MFFYSLPRLVPPSLDRERNKDPQTLKFLVVYMFRIIIIIFYLLSCGFKGDEMGSGEKNNKQMLMTGKSFPQDH